MIVINKPKLFIEAEFVIISSEINIFEEKEILWYKFPVEFQNYLVTENLDAFLVGLLFLGLKNGYDIRLESQVSEKLYYNLTHYLIPALCLANPALTRIEILPKELNGQNLNTGNIAGTGLSCGIDSFATYYDHIKENGRFSIGYFTFFNVGSHGDMGGERARKVYKERLHAVREFAMGENKKVITVDSNLSEILQVNFQKSHSLRSISCVLHLQKLFRNYYYASAYRFDHFKLNLIDTSDSDIFNLNMLSTESTSFYSSVAQLSRVERSQLVSQNPSTYPFLDVCTNPWIDKPYLNCSYCYKCLRTQLTLEIGDNLKFYNQVFDLKKYQEIKYKYIGELLGKNGKSPLDQELIAYLKERNYHLPTKVYIYGLLYRYNFYKLKLKRYFKEIIENN
ncbi:hypothetical protein DET49_10777 [Salegentibacter sp. 24]|uniref:hypothetical protein n=1 Tax=Salegentibacter sp. 24 TaxID=2183986 RepID=UPI00105DF175|nr:hypothetical protein [Salegentibacter sp. 24]TDN89161.1 hypothetical protein DET49_10777 [Salegentibacter sp. 24]